MEKSYVAIDLKSFYASVECVERGLDPFDTNLVVADPSRTEKTICLAVSPALKGYGVGGRPRLFEVVQRVRQINGQRRGNAQGGGRGGKSFSVRELSRDGTLLVDYLVAPPRMALYMSYSARIYEIYLKYVAPEDVFAYSVDEVFIDLTNYLSSYKLTARELTSRILLDVYRSTGITATAGLGTNLYLCKVAMDILAKKSAPDENGVRIASLDELSYRKLLWSHRPLTDFWRVGHAYQKKLASYGIYTMGDIARASLECEELLYRLFGVNAELLIDHAWGWEPCTMEQIKAYRPSTSSVSTGQVLSCPYAADRARVVVMEMCEALVLDLVARSLATDQVVVTVGYDAQSLADGGTCYTGELTLDRYGRAVPKHMHATVNLSSYTSSTKEIVDAVLASFDENVNKRLLIRRINITANRVADESARKHPKAKQLDIFTDVAALREREARAEVAYEREKRMQRAMLRIKQKYGKNAIVKGHSFEDGATAMERNTQIGGHKA